LSTLWGEVRYTALMNESQYGNTEIVRLLIEARSDVNMQDNEGYSALKVALNNGHTEIVQLLKEAGAE